MVCFFLDLICIALGTKSSISQIPTQNEWKQVFDIAKKQTVLGICFVGVQKLRERKSESVANLPQTLFMQWLAIVAKIQQRNEMMDGLSAKLWQTLYDAGLKSAILKGQGAALSYGALSSFRQSGDIDIWVRGGFDVVNTYVQETYPSTDVAYHRFHYDVFEETEVEMHFRPTLMRNLIDNYKLQKWCESFQPEKFIQTDKGFAIPPVAFNRVFLLTHIYRHFLFEGVGLRQIMDLFYVLKNDRASENDKIDSMSILTKLRMKRFAEAVMWVLNECFGLPKNYLLCMPNEKEGRFLLSEILATGNFGQGDKRYHNDSKLKMMMRHGMHLWVHYPSEVVWTPIWLVYHKYWRKIMRKRINNIVKNG